MQLVVAGLAGHCWVIWRCGSGYWVITGLTGCHWFVIQCYSSLGYTVGVGYSCGSGCTIVVVIPIVVVSTAVVAVVFLLVTTCHFKDTSWVSLFEAGKWVVTYVMVHFCDAPPGSPTSWVPPGVLHIPKNFHWAMMSHPHPSGEGKGGLESLLGMLVIVPTSLNRGEGQTMGWFAAWGILEEGGGGGGMNARSTTKLILNWNFTVMPKDCA